MRSSVSGVPTIRPTLAMAMGHAPLRVKPGSRVRLPDGFDPGDRFGLHKKKDGARLLQRGAGLLEEYQRRLAAQDTYGVLVVLQAIDAGGKDGMPPGVVR